MEAWKLDQTRPERAAGASYYLAKPTFALQRRAMAAGKAAAPVYALQLGWEPDSSERFEVGIRPGWFTNDSLEVMLDENGRATQLNSKRTDESAQAFVGLTKLAAEVAKLAMMDARASTESKVFLFAEETGLLKKTFPRLEDRAHLERFLDATPEARKGDARGRSLTRMLRDALEADVCPGSDPLLLHGSAKSIVSGYANLTAAYSDVERVPEVRCPAPEMQPPPGFQLPANNIGTCAWNPPRPADKNDLPSWSCHMEKFLGDAIVAIVANLKSLDRAAGGAESTKVKDVLALIRSDISSRIADVVSALAATPPSPHEIAQRRAELEQAIRRLERTADEALRIDDRLSGRALAGRRRELQRFLTSRIPSGANGKVSQAYVQFGDELNKILDSITGVVGRAPEGDLLSATDVTSVVKDDIYVDRWASLDGIEATRRIIAGARVKYEVNQAVFIVTPAASRGAR